MTCLFTCVTIIGINPAFSGLKFPRSKFKSQGYSAKQLNSAEAFFDILIRKRHSLYFELLDVKMGNLYGHLLKNNPELKDYKRKAERKRYGVGAVGLPRQALNGVIRYIVERLYNKPKKKL